MKHLLFIVIFVAISYAAKGQEIQYTGCSGIVAAPYPFTLSLTGTVDDSSIIRNTYTSALPGASCSAGICAFRIQWSVVNSRWEIQLSTNGGASFDNILYTNTAAAYPNPPDLSLGTWIGQPPCTGQAVTLLSGDVQSDTTLGLQAIDENYKVTVFPNPVTSILNVESNVVVKQVRIVDVLGKEILKTISKTIDVSQLNQGVYFIEIVTENNQTIIKRFIKN